MAEQQTDSSQSLKIFTLSQVAASLHSVVSKNYPGRYWIKAEMARLHRYPHSGHCYPDLVEKQSDKVVAQFRAILWSDNYLSINKRFQEITGQPLHDGMNILFQASVTFHPQYGLSLQIHDIEPAFTLGEMARQRRAAIQKLKTEGFYHLNHQKTFPVLPARIAVISVETSKGYNDFCNILTQHARRYRVSWELFPALLQGVNAAASIIGRLEEIDREKHLFDLVAIVRGGGGEVGLDCYDDYTLASVVARFPLPVITGIGHATNQTVVEMVAHDNKITPTDVAYSIVKSFAEAEQNLQKTARALQKGVGNFAALQKAKLQAKSEKLHQVTKRRIDIERNSLNLVRSLLPLHCRSFVNRLKQTHASIIPRLALATAWLFRDQRGQLTAFDHKIRQSDPASLLQRGYSITLCQGRIVTSTTQINPGDRLTTRLADGSISSTIDSINKPDTTHHGNEPNL